MRKSNWIAVVAVVLALAAVSFYGYRRWSGAPDGPDGDLLSRMPADASAVLCVDLEALRRSPFLAELYRWAPQPPADVDYAQFLRDTGFNYESDLDRVGIAVLKLGQDSTLFAVAEGRFDRKKITAYALRSGTRENRAGRDIFSVPASRNARRVFFTFLRRGRIALTDDANLASFLSESHKDADTQEWRARFTRVAGSPLFAVVRQQAGTGAAIAAEAPGGIRSPQLSALLDQLQWITIAGKPENDRLRLVLEGEGASAAAVRQLSDLMNGVLVLAQAGLSDPKMKQQLGPQLRDAYLEMLKSADVSQIDRGETKSVRLVFDLTPEFLEASRNATTAIPAAPNAKIPPAKSLSRKLSPAQKK